MKANVVMFPVENEPISGTRMRRLEDLIVALVQRAYADDPDDDPHAGCEQGYCLICEAETLVGNRREEPRG